MDFELPAIPGFGSESTEEVLARIKESGRDASFRAAKNSVRSKERILESLGIEDSAQPTKSGINKFFDVLDTGGQAVRGVIAKSLDLAGYEDLGFLDAASQGIGKDLTVGDILKETDTLQGPGAATAVARGTTSFLGDVFTDPTTYISLGAKGLGQAAGRGLSKKKLTTSFGKETPQEIILRMTNSAEAVELDKINKSLANIKEGPLAIARRAEVGGLASKSVNETLNNLSSLAKKKKDLAHFTDPPAKVVAEINKLESELLEQVGLTSSTMLDDIYAKPALRFVSPFNANARDIPIVTEATEKLFQQLGGPFYGAVRKVGGDTVDLLRQAGKGTTPVISPVAAKAARFAEFLQDAPKLLSRKAQHLGSKVGLSATKDYEISRLRIVDKVENQKNALSEQFQLDSETLESLSAIAEQEFTIAKKVFLKAKVDGSPLKGRELDEINKRFESVLEKAEESFGTNAREFLEFMRGDFKRMGDEAVDKGFMNGIIQGYVPHSYQVADARSALPEDAAKSLYGSSGVFDGFSSRVKGDREGFTFQRALYETLEDATIQGKRPERNLLDLWANRSIQQERMLASKDYMERMGIEYAMPVGVRQHLEELFRSHNTKKQREGLEFLRASGITIDPEIAINPRKSREFYTAKATKLFPDTDQVKIRAVVEEKALKKFPDDEELRNLYIAKNTPSVSPHIAKARKEFIDESTPIIAKNGTALSPPDYLRLRDGVEAGSEKAKAIADDLGLKFSPEEHGKVVSLWDGGLYKIPRDADGLPLDADEYKRLKRIYELGADGSAEYAGAAGAAKKYRLDFVDDLDYNVSPEDITKLGRKVTLQDIEEGSSLVASGQGIQLGRAGESELTRGGGTVLSDKFKHITKGLDTDTRVWAEGLLPEPVARVIEDSLDTRNTYQRLASNLKDDPAGRAIDTLAKNYFGWLRALKMGSTVVWPAYHIRNAFSAQVQGLGGATIFDQFNPLKLVDSHLISTGKKELFSPTMGRNVSHAEYKAMLGQFGINSNPYFSVDALEHIADVASVQAGKGVMKGKVGQLAQYPLSLTQKIETYGREHLFQTLIKQGVDPQSAAQKSVELLIDYAHGKTKFEKDFLNNIIFFYSFARGEAANTLHKLVSTPGAITQQLHLVDGIAETLRDPEAIPIPESLEDQMQSIRSKESLSRVIGRDAEGLPELLTGIGLPVEDLTRFINFQVPEEITVNTLIDASLKSGQRGGQQLLASVNPILRAPLEILANKNFFFDRPLDDKNLRRFPKMEPDIPKLMPHKFDAIPDGVWRGLDAVTQKVLSGQDNGDGTWTVNPYRLSVLSMTVPGIGRYVTTRNFLMKEDVPLNRRLGRALTGVKTQSMDPEKALVFERKRELDEKFRRLGLPTSKRGLQQYNAIQQAGEDDYGDLD